MKVVKIKMGTHYAPMYSLNLYKSKKKLPITDEISKK